MALFRVAALVLTGQGQRGTLPPERPAKVQQFEADALLPKLRKASCDTDDEDYAAAQLY
jgi:hypothetical protein